MPPDFFAQRIADIRTAGPKEGLFLFLGSLLYYHVESFLCSESFMILWALWGLNFVSGSALAIRDRTWEPRKSAKSVAGFCATLIPLGVAWVCRIIAFPGSGPFAASLELGLYLYYASSALENTAHLFPQGSSIRVLLEYFPTKLPHPQPAIPVLLAATLATGEQLSAQTIGTPVIVVPATDKEAAK